MIGYLWNFCPFVAEKVWKMEGKLDPSFSHRIFGFKLIYGKDNIGFLEALFDCVLKSRVKL